MQTHALISKLKISKLSDYFLFSFSTTIFFFHTNNLMNQFNKSKNLDKVELTSHHLSIKSKITVLCKLQWKKPRCGSRRKQAELIYQQTLTHVAFMRISLVWGSIHTARGSWHLSYHWSLTWKLPRLPWLPWLPRISSKLFLAHWWFITGVTRLALTGIAWMWPIWIHVSLRALVGWHWLLVARIMRGIHGIHLWWNRLLCRRMWLRWLMLGSGWHWSLRTDW